MMTSIMLEGMQEVIRRTLVRLKWQGPLKKANGNVQVIHESLITEIKDLEEKRNVASTSKEKAELKKSIDFYKEVLEDFKNWKNHKEEGAE